MATKHEFQVEMTCGGCSGAVEKVLGKEGIANVEIDLEKKRVFVTSELAADDILAIIKKAGKAASYIGKA